MPQSPDRVQLPDRVASSRDARLPGECGGQSGRVFLFFSNRLGCLGSLLVSAVLTLVVLLVLDVL
ncbi:hypothetical protein GCM10027451_20270 [Geodermatophilus aquaeductus]